MVILSLFIHCLFSAKDAYSLKAPLPNAMLTNLLPLFSTTVFYAVYYLISAFKFDVQIEPSAVPYDYVLQLCVAYMLFALSKRIWIFCLIHALIMGILYVGNAVKISFFGGPIMPDDVYALRSLLLILEGWRFFAAAIPLAAIASLLLFNFSMRHWSAYLSTLIILLLSIMLVYKPASIVTPIDKYFGNSVWDQRSNYLWHGATLYTLQEGARYFALADVPPDPDKVQEASERLLANAVKKETEANAFTPRNVHIVLLESFWDPNGLKKARFNQNPLSPDFRKLWKNADYSHALTPVFGGYTANSEFEVLCGFPVIKDNVKFERQLLNDVPCLPHILHDKGYRTVASHPNVPVFWNRVNAYRRMGFETYWSQQDFVLDDMNREFLADSSLYRQVFEKISEPLATKQPILDYIVTYFGHWNYPLSKSRPNKITSPSKVEDVTAYANTAYYKSRELMAFVEQMRKRDPDGIIIVFGDHLPFLGENFEGYIDSGVLAENRSSFTPEMFKFYVTTPMIIIDGKRGPLKIGSLPLYQVPGLVLKLLNFSEPSIMDFTAPLPGMQIRPLPGLHFNLLNGGKIDLCKEPPYSETCRLSSEWLQDVTTISNDLFIGRQFSRPKHPRSDQKNPEQTGIAPLQVSNGQNEN